MKLDKIEKDNIFKLHTLESRLVLTFSVRQKVLRLNTQAELSQIQGEDHIRDPAAGWMKLLSQGLSSSQSSS